MASGGMGDVVGRRASQVPDAVAGMLFLGCGLG